MAGADDDRTEERSAPVGSAPKPAGLARLGLALLVLGTVALLGWVLTIWWRTSGATQESLAAWAVLAVAGLWLAIGLTARARARSKQPDHDGSGPDAGFLIDGAQPRSRVGRIAQILLIQGRKGGNVGIALWCCVLVTLASLYTTFNGTLSFFGLKPLSAAFGLLLALGIQGFLFVSSFLVAEEYVAHSRAKQWGRGGRGLANWFLVRQFSLVAAMLVCMFGSMFFSFASHFENVYGPERLVLANRENAREDTEGALIAAGDAIVAERDEVAGRLRGSSAWRTFAQHLDELLAIADKQPDAVRAITEARRGKAEAERATVGREIEDRKKALAEIDGRIGAEKARDGVAEEASAGEIEDLTALRQKERELGERKSLFETAMRVEFKTGNRPEEVPADCQKVALESARRTAKKSANGRTIKYVKGPTYECLEGFAKEASERLDAVRGRIARIERARDDKTTAAATRRATIDKQSAESGRLVGEIAAAERRLRAAQQEIAAIDGSQAEAFATASGGEGLSKALRRNRDEYIRTGSKDLFDRIVASCANLLEIVQSSKVGGKQDLSGACDTSSLSTPVERLAALSAAEKQYKEQCAINGGLYEFKSPMDFVRKGNECLALAGVPRRTVQERKRVNEIAQLNHPATSNFERSIASIQRGDRLAWLSLALAIAVDLLVFLGALLAERARSSPLTRTGWFESAEEERDVFPGFSELRQDDPNIRAARHIIPALVRLTPTSPGGEAQARPVVDLSLIAPGERANARRLLNIVSMSRRGLAYGIAGRDDLFEVEPDLILFLNRKLAEFEREQALERAMRKGAAGDPRDSDDPALYAEMVREQRMTTPSPAEDMVQSPGAMDDYAPPPPPPPRARSGNASAKLRTFKSRGGGWLR